MHKHQWIGVLPCLVCKDCRLAKYSPTHAIEMASMARLVIELRKDPSKRADMHAAISDLDRQVFPLSKEEYMRSMFVADVEDANSDSLINALKQTSFITEAELCSTKSIKDKVGFITMETSNHIDEALL